MNITLLIITSLALLVALPTLYFAFRKRASSVEHVRPADAVLSDVVRWGEIGKFAPLKMGVLVLRSDSVALYDKSNTEIFRYPIKESNILFVSTKMGLQVKVNDKKYDVRIDYGSVPAYFSVAKRYSLWADKIKELGGPHFIDDQGPAGRLLFNPRNNRVYYWGRFVIIAIVFLIFFGVAALTR